MTTRLAVLASGSGSNLQAVLDACTAGAIEAEVVLVVSDRPGARALERARAAGRAAIALAVEPGEPRHAYDQRLGEVVLASEPDLVVLAGWMRLLSTSFLDRFPGKVLNLHPARPGELPGVRAIERAYAEAQAGHRSHTGVMVHLVPDEGVDDGPLLATVDVPILPGDSLDDLATRVHSAEHQLLVEVLAAMCGPDGPVASSRRFPTPTPQEHCA
jgi:phosphoribosylglycinamide formyltransferase-1